MPLSKEDLDRIQEALKGSNYTSDADIKALTDLGLVIRSKPDAEVYETNLRTQVRDQVRGEEDLPAYKNIETELEKLTGVKKNDGEKASEFLNRIVAPMKGNIETLQKEIAGLKAGGDDKDNPRIQALSDELKAAQKENAKLQKEYGTKLNQIKIDSAIEEMRKVASGIPLNVPDEVKQDIIDARINKFQKEYDIRVNDKGEIETVNKNTGKVEVDTNTLSMIQPASLVGNYFADIKAKDGGEGGTGLKPDAKKTDGAAGITVDLGTVKSRVQLHETLQKSGLTTNSVEFDKAFNEHVSNYEKTTGQRMPLEAPSE